MAAATVAAVATVVGTGASIYQGREAAKEQKKASNLRESMASIREARARRKQAREAAVARGAIVNSAAQTGRTGSSSAIQGEQFVQGQETTGLTQISTDRAFSRDLSSINQSVADSKSRQATFGAFASVTGKFAGEKGFQDLGAGIKTIFSDN